MIVQGEVIFQDQIYAANTAMRGDFTYWAVRGALVRRGVHGRIADRATDRILQLARKEKRIKYIGGRGKIWRAI